MARFSFERHSGRVISAARIAFASLFLFAVWIDPTQPAQAAEVSYTILGAYVLAAAAIAIVTWNNWWLDSRLAAPAHILDVVIFAALVVATAGYTSPFFVFFVFVLLSSAIRWDWYQTALTAAALIALFLAAGLIVNQSTVGDFELQRFIIRTGHLLILSGLIIWFGIHQEQLLADSPAQSADLTLDQATESILRGAAESCRASRALLTWRDHELGEQFALELNEGAIRSVPVTAQPDFAPFPDGTPYLYDVEQGHALAHHPTRGRRQIRTSDEIRAGSAQLPLSAGLAIPLVHPTGSGMLILEDVSSLSSDHLPLGEKLGQNVVAEIQRHALIRAMEESGESRARLAFARDLHDNVVQFLAGATIRIEAMLRKSRTTGVPQEELTELKRLMLQEQRDLRLFVETLKTGESIDSGTLESALSALCQRLANQWSIECRLKAEMPAMAVPMRIHLDAQQLVREAVANAARHGKASLVTIRATLYERSLKLLVNDNGQGIGSRTGDPPWSLSGRVSSAGGKMDIESSDKGTQISIDLPLRKARA